MIDKFFERKNFYDPHGMFSSSWSKNYMTQVIPKSDELPISSNVPDNYEDDYELGKNSTEKFVLPIVSQHRDDSYRKLMSNPTQRNEFIEHFFTNIFNIESKDKLKNLMAKAVADPRNSNDDDIYQYIKQHLDEGSSDPLNEFSKVVKSLLQTRWQRKELVKETVTILHRLKRLGKINGLVSIGDTGKLVRELTENEFVSGNVWIVHDDLGGLVQMIERGSENEVGEFVQIDYNNPIFIKIPSESADLITLNIGLHHFPQETILPFLNEVYRILRKGGLFIVREHDASPEIIPVLDLAHSIFNAVTGVSPLNDRHEIRAFRPILEWRKIIESVGLTDSYLYDIESGDPTIDEMMCFYKQSLLLSPDENRSSNVVTKKKADLRPALSDVIPKEMALIIENMANQAPNLALELSRVGIAKTITLLIDLTENLKNVDLVQSNKPLELLMGGLSRQALDPLISMLNDFQLHLQSAERTEAEIKLIPDEFIVLLKGFLKNAHKGSASPMELVIAGVLKEINTFLSSSKKEENTTAVKVYRNRYVLIIFNVNLSCVAQLLILCINLTCS